MASNVEWNLIKVYRISNTFFLVNRKLLRMVMADSRWLVNVQTRIKGSTVSIQRRDVTFDCDIHDWFIIFPITPNSIRVFPFFCLFKFTFDECTMNVCVCLCVSMNNIVAYNPEFLNGLICFLFYRFFCLLSSLSVLTVIRRLCRRQRWLGSTLSKSHIPNYSITS